MDKQFLVLLSDKQKHLMTKELIQTHVDYLKKVKVGRSFALLWSMCGWNSGDDRQSKSPGRGEKAHRSRPFFKSRILSK